MWYVIQTRSGKENTVKTYIESITESQPFPPECRLIYYESKRKYLGQWHSEKRLLFPGYIFIISDEAEQLRQQLKKVPEFTRILGTDKEIVPLDAEEEAFIRSLSEDTDTVAMSYGVQENDRIIVRSGNLKGYESMIRKIDRHKRKAWIEIEMFGDTRLVEVGLEIVEKK